MWFLFSSTPWEFGFELNLKSKDQCAISDNNDGSNTSALSSTIFQKWPKRHFRCFNSLSLKNQTWWKVFERVRVQRENAFGNTWSHIICKTHAGLCTCRVTNSWRNWEIHWTKDEGSKRQLNMCTETGGITIQAHLTILRKMISLQYFRMLV